MIAGQAEGHVLAENVWLLSINGGSSSLEFSAGDGHSDR
jgi:hypothetical protein